MHGIIIKITNLQIIFKIRVIKTKQIVYRIKEIISLETRLVVGSAESTDIVTLFTTLVRSPTQC